MTRSETRGTEAEDGLRRALESAVRDVGVPPGLTARVRAGGRRRLRRRRAVVLVPVTAVVAGALAVLGGALPGSRPDAVVPAASLDPRPEPAPTAAAVPAGEDEAVAEFLTEHTYDDAVALGELWQTDPWDAKVTAGRLLLAGGTVPQP
jgi:hypothetical protein